MWPWHFLSAVVCARAATAAVTFPLEAKWSATLPAPPAFAPAFDTDRVYVSLQTNQLVALLINDGSVAWSVECPMTAPPAAGAGLVFAGSDGLDRSAGRQPTAARSGAVRFRDASSRCIGTPAGCSRRPSRVCFFAIRAADGEILWQKDFGSPLSAPPAPAGDRLYLPLKDGRVVALSLQTGDEIWTHKLAESAAAFCRSAIASSSARATINFIR